MLTSKKLVEYLVHVSHRACLAVLNNYEALHAHLTETDDAESAALALLLENTFFFSKD